MPFIQSDKRPLVRSNPTQYMKEPGDRCYLIYAEMMRLWRLSPRWTTADKIHEDFVMNVEDNAFLEALYSKSPMTGWNELCNAASLAWQVFFNEEVLPYEARKKRENGAI